MKKVSALILAAGASRRMGQPKQLLDWGGLPLVRAVALAACATHSSEVVVVTGAAQQAVAAALNGVVLRIVENSAYATGQASSLRVGIESLAQDADAALVLLGDQPFVSTELINRLIAIYEATNALIVAPRYRGVRGNPVLFDHRLFTELCTISGDQGARVLLSNYADQISYLDLEDDRPLIDIDTPEIYQQLVRDEGLYAPHNRPD